MTRDGRGRRRRRRGRPALQRPGAWTARSSRQAADIALRGGTRHARRAAHRRGGGRDRRAAARHDVLEPVERYGVERFAADLAAAGGAGRDHARPDPRRGRATGSRPRDAHGLDRVFLVAPSLAPTRGSRVDRRGLPRLRLRRLDDGRHRHPGDRSATARRDAGRAAPARRTDLPVVRRASACPTATRPPRSRGFADGVIVGSAFVRALLERRDATPVRCAAGRRARGRRARGRATRSRAPVPTGDDARRDALPFIPSPTPGRLAPRPAPVRGYALCIIARHLVAVWIGERRWVARGGAPGHVAATSRSGRCRSASSAAGSTT